MSDQTTTILGLKRELKTVRAKVRELTTETKRWREVTSTLRALAGLSDAQYSRLLNAASLPLTE